MIALLIVIMIYIVGQWIRGKKRGSSKAILLILIGFVLAGISFGVKEWRYYERGSPQKDREQGTQTSSYSLFAGEGVIKDILNQGKYVWSYQGGEYMLYSSKEYTIGDRLRLVGNLQKNIKDD